MLHTLHLQAAVSSDVYTGLRQTRQHIDDSRLCLRAQVLMQKKVNTRDRRKGLQLVMRHKILELIVETHPETNHTCVTRK